MALDNNSCCACRLRSYAKVESWREETRFYQQGLVYPL